MVGGGSRGNDVLSLCFHRPSLVVLHRLVPGTVVITPGLVSVRLVRVRLRQRSQEMLD